MFTSSSPIAPSPTMPMRCPCSVRTSTVAPSSSSCAHRCAICARMATGSRRASAIVTPSTCSAIARARMPRPLVITTGLASSSGNIRLPTPTAGLCTQRRRDADGKMSRSTNGVNAASASGRRRRSVSRSQASLTVCCGKSRRIWSTKCRGMTQAGAGLMTPTRMFIARQEGGKAERRGRRKGRKEGKAERRKGRKGCRVTQCCPYAFRPSCLAAFAAFPPSASCLPAFPRLPALHKCRFVRRSCT